MTTYFISDLHLTPERPRTNDLFLEFLDEAARGADALYILGDLFEYWIGDDAAGAIGQSNIMDALRRFTDRGVATYFMHGNRDFLVGDAFAARTGCQLVSDPTLIEVDGRKVLLMHGDSLCTDDTAHQAFRALVRDPAWQQGFLNSPVADRLELALNARSQSALHTSMTSMDIMDVNTRAVEQEMERHDVDVLVHGHTHRPGFHALRVNGREATRIVLGDWYEQTSVLRYDEGGFRLSDDRVKYPSVELPRTGSGNVR